MRKGSQEIIRRCEGRKIDCIFSSGRRGGTGKKSAIKFGVSGQPLKGVVLVARGNVQRKLLRERRVEGEGGGGAFH